MTFEELQEAVFSDPVVLELYEELQRERELRNLLLDMKEKAGITSTELAKRMGISQPEVSRLERNAIRSSIARLEKYAQACGAKLNFFAQYS